MLSDTLLRSTSWVEVISQAQLAVEGQFSNMPKDPWTDAPEQVSEQVRWPAI